MPRDQITAEQVADARRGMGLTQEQLARELECSVSTIQCWENGRTTPPGFLLLALAQLKLRMEEGNGQDA